MGYRVRELPALVVNDFAPQGLLLCMGWRRTNQEVDRERLGHGTKRRLDGVNSLAVIKRSRENRFDDVSDTLWAGSPAGKNHLDIACDSIRHDGPLCEQLATFRH
jgi:hypothetical protein